jgi:hypothetical protein
MTRRNWFAAIATVFAERAPIARAASFIAASMHRAAPIPAWRVAEKRYLQRLIIRRTIWFFDNDLDQVARYFGMSRSAFARRMQKLGLRHDSASDPKLNLDIAYQELRLFCRASYSIRLDVYKNNPKNASGRI